MEDLHFLKAALKFLKENWNTSDQKFSQQVLAKKLEISDSYLSKAKEIPSFATNLKPKILKQIAANGGEYYPEKLIIKSEDGKEYPIAYKKKENFSLISQLGVVSKEVKRHLFRTKKIKILSTWGGETYDELVKLIELNPTKKFWDNIEEIQILMLNPNSEGTNLRSKGLRGGNAETGFLRIKENLQEIATFVRAKKLEKKIFVRLYDQLPSTKLVIFDEIILIGFFLVNTMSRSSHHILLNKEEASKHAAELEHHFRTIWEEPTTIPFDFKKAGKQFEQWEAPVYKRYNPNSYSNIVGTYYLYYPEQYSALEGKTSDYYKKNKKVCSIGRNILKIEQKEEDDIGKLTCKMKPAGFEEDFIYEGQLTNKGFDNRDFLILQLTNKRRTRILNLTFSINNTKIRSINFGIFSNIYYGSSKIGGGRVILVKAEKEYHELKAKSIDPRKPSFKEDPTLETPGIIQYLSKKHDALLPSACKEQELIPSLKCAGIYNVYAYKRDNIQILKGIIEILPSGMIRYKNQLKGYEGHGWAYKNNDNLYIEIVNSEERISRSGVFIIKIGNNPSSSNTQKILQGVSASPTWIKEIPVAARIVLERRDGKETFEDSKPKKLIADTLEGEVKEIFALPKSEDEIAKIPEPVKNHLIVSE